MIIDTPATADSGNTIAITLADYGITTVLGIHGYTHTTDGTVVVVEAPTTAVASGVLTITIGGTSANQRRVYEVFFI